MDNDVYNVLVYARALGIIPPSHAHMCELCMHASVTLCMHTCMHMYVTLLNLNTRGILPYMVRLYSMGMYKCYIECMYIDLCIHNLLRIYYIGFSCVRLGPLLISESRSLSGECIYPMDLR